MYYRDNCNFTKKSTCIICGKEFFIITGGQKCCSKECSKIYKQQYRKKYNKEHAEELKQYRKENKDKAREYNKEYRLKNKEKLRDKRRKYEKTHIEQIRNYRNKNKHKFYSCTSDYYREYYQKNKNKVKQISIKSKRKQRQNISVRIRDTISRQISFGLNKKNSNKTFSTFKLLNYTVEELKQHLESLFQEGMNWDNYGINGWHIDHIKPVASFNLANIDGTPNLEEIQKCWSLENLQPLWAKDNISKGAWYIDEFGNKKQYRHNKI